jgi:hypothetical protein
MSRKDTYYKLNQQLAYLTNDEISNIIKVKKSDTKKWGVNKIYILNKIKIFIKAIPIAKIYAENHFNTANLYNLPAYYNYGYGSAGVNPWRELLIHIKTTNFVLSGECSNFPILYHYRLIEDNNNDNIETGMSQKLLDR